MPCEPTQNSRFRGHNPRRSHTPSNSLIWLPRLCMSLGIPPLPASPGAGGRHLLRSLVSGALGWGRRAGHGGGVRVAQAGQRSSGARGAAAGSTGCRDRSRHREFREGGRRLGPDQGPGALGEGKSGEHGRAGLVPRGRGERTGANSNARGWSSCLGTRLEDAWGPGRALLSRSIRRFLP